MATETKKTGATMKDAFLFIMASAIAVLFAWNVILTAGLLFTIDALASEAKLVHQIVELEKITHGVASTPGSR